MGYIEKSKIPLAGARHSGMERQRIKSPFKSTLAGAAARLLKSLRLIGYAICLPFRLVSQLRASILLTEADAKRSVTANRRRNQR
jgi:hypothetical protein